MGHMDALNLNLLQESLDAFKPHLDEVLNHFYGELFERAPQMRAEFSQVDRESSQRSFVASLIYIIDQLQYEQTSQIASYLRSMHGRHPEYAYKKYYKKNILAETWNATLKYFFEEQWTEELVEAWANLFDFIVEGMQPLVGETSVAVSPTQVHAELYAPQQTQSSVSTKFSANSVQDSSPFADDFLRKIAIDWSHKYLQSILEEQVSSAQFKNLVKMHVHVLLSQVLEEETKKAMGAIRGQSPDVPLYRAV